MVLFLPFDNPGGVIEISEELILPDTFLYGVIHSPMKGSWDEDNRIKIGINFIGLQAIKTLLETGVMFNPYDPKNKDRLIVQDMHATFEQTMNFLGYHEYDIEDEDDDHNDEEEYEFDDLDDLEDDFPAEEPEDLFCSDDYDDYDEYDDSFG